MRDCYGDNKLKYFLNVLQQWYECRTLIIDFPGVSKRLESFKKKISTGQDLIQNYGQKPYLPAKCDTFCG